MSPPIDHDIAAALLRVMPLDLRLLDSRSADEKKRFEVTIRTCPICGGWTESAIRALGAEAVEHEVKIDEYRPIRTCRECDAACRHLGHSVSIMLLRQAEMHLKLWYASRTGKGGA